MAKKLSFAMCFIQVAQNPPFDAFGNTVDKCGIRMSFQRSHTSTYTYLHNLGLIGLMELFQARLYDVVAKSVWGWQVDLLLDTVSKKQISSVKVGG